MNADSSAQPDLGAIERRLAEEQALTAQIVEYIHTPTPWDKADVPAFQLRGVRLHSERDDIRAHYANDIAALLARVKQLERERNDALTTLHGVATSAPDVAQAEGR